MIIEYDMVGLIKMICIFNLVVKTMVDKGTL